MSIQQTDRRVTLAVVVSFALIAAISAVYALSLQLGDVAVNWAILVADILGAGACAVLCYILWRASEKGEDLRRVWVYLGIGLALWTLAEVVYAVYGLGLQVDTPSPSLADLLWVPGYIPIIAAFWLRFSILRVPLTRGQWIALLGGFVVLGVLSVVYVIAPSMPGAEDMPSALGSPAEIANLLLSILYPLGDLLMALGAGLMILALLGGRFSQTWGLIALGCIAIAVADSMYYAGLANGMYTEALPVNLFTAASDISYFVGYVVIALGLFMQARLERAL